MPLFRIPWMKHFFRSARIIFRWPTERRIIFEPRAGWIQSNGSRIKHVDMFTRTSLQKIVMGTQPVALSTSVILQLNGSILTTKRWHHASTTRLAPRSKCWAGGNRAFPKKKTSFFEWQWTKYWYIGSRSSSSSSSSPNHHCHKCDTNWLLSWTWCWPLHWKWNALDASFFHRPRSNTNDRRCQKGSFVRKQ